MNDRRELTVEASDLALRGWPETLTLDAETLRRADLPADLAGAVFERLPRLDDIDQRENEIRSVYYWVPGTGLRVWND